MPIKIGIVGFGKIARDQHAPALNASPDFKLVAVASPNIHVEDMDNFEDMASMLKARADIDAVALCAPPQLRYRQARAALAAGKHVLLEKPPGATLGEIADLSATAKKADRTLFASWHSRHAPSVEPARSWLASRQVTAVDIDWKEDVRVWHPGQAWVWQPGGLGVFDPGINALSIITRILPRPFFLREATLLFPDNRAAPIAAKLNFADACDTPIRAEFDWRQTGPQTWNIDIQTKTGRLLLSQGASRMQVNDDILIDTTEAEYPSLYAHFAELINGRRSDVDVRPLRHVADGFLLGRHDRVAPFVEDD